jgi:hypothetical protein
MSTVSRILAVAGVALVAATLSACGPHGATPSPSATALSDLAPLGRGFLGGNPTPTPEATVSPERGSWDGVEPPAGYRAVLIAAGDDVASTTVSEAVERWAEAESVDLEVLNASHDDDVADHLDAAVALKPDLVLGAGDGVVDVFTLLTPQHLSQKFLMIGAELPEPTENVSSVIWPGAAFRGSGLGTSGDIDPATFTAARADEAVRAGVAGMLHGLNGIVLSLP